MLLPESLQLLINALERLPGIGPKSASRLAFYFLRAPEEVSQDLVLSAVNLALDQSRELQQKLMGPLAGGLPF